MILERGITLIGLTFCNLLGDGAIQLALPFETVGQPVVLDGAVDSVRVRSRVLGGTTML